MNKLSSVMNEFLKELEYEDVVRVKDEITNGKIETLINKRIEEIESRLKACPTCNTLLERDGSIVLQFGGSGFRKEARFCGIDCLEYFLAKMRDVIVFNK